MPGTIKAVLENSPVTASAPCRIDLGGTLDLEAFCLTLGHLRPSTFNIAVDLRTRVRLSAFRKGRVLISSRGFEDAAFTLDQAPFDHPMGLMFAIAAYFRAEGVRVEIDSASPPRSALGGSSAAAVALIAAFSAARQRLDHPPLSRRGIVTLGHALEQGAAGVPCGRQDQLAAAFGGVNQWFWLPGTTATPYRRRVVVRRPAHRMLAKRLMLAYCGIPHESKNINGQWVQQFLAGRFRSRWVEIVDCTHRFIHALAAGDLDTACRAMNRETRIRRQLTPAVVDEIGSELVAAALDRGCGARFTGAGGGGCVWALGAVEALDRLRPLWESTLSKRKDARLLEFGIDAKGVRVSTEA